MAGYVDTTDDNGGVHLNSGIPNHAFYLAATALGGNAWEGAGQVWYDVLTGGTLPTDCDFQTFARATTAAAGQRFGAGSASAQGVQDAWVQVGVLTAAVRLRRTGGLAGGSRERTVSFADLPEDDAASWRDLVVGDRLQQLAAPEAGPRPDAFTYHVASPPGGDEVALPEHGIPDHVRALFARTLNA
jgi:hypothetical protein